MLTISGTPILTRRMTMRRETIRALEVRKNSVMAERRKSNMQTLGANNEYGVTTANSVFKTHLLLCCYSTNHASHFVNNYFICFVKINY